MVRFGSILMKDGINKSLLEFLVCPLSKQPLRLCEKTNSLISDTIGVSYPIVDGIPRLVPADGKIIEADDALNSDGSVDLPGKRTDDQSGSS
ncbi:Protein preY, mitochondrial [Capsicum chinense]|uniref:Protein preY, mitochondrial n=1 Tax=Capsicum annuum TaxID=4072 RepID=A0A1U8GGR6_CAPAN|nr:Protein preY, mitochondrial [Capsicum annuum]PHT83102.1 Protein preY, mitochondrial [Capsicum annuum]PHU19339.1 Protein preY, mitochondrial [Capsicum chinense]